MNDPPSRPTGLEQPVIRARLLTAAPDGRLHLEFGAPPSGSWTLVRAELARRLAEQAVSEAATVPEAELVAFASGRRVPVRTARPAVVESAEQDPATADVAGSRTAAPPEFLRRPDMLTGVVLAGRLGISRATVALRRSSGKLLALECGTKRGFRFPDWQVELVADADSRGLFEAVLHQLRPRGALTAYRFFTSASAALAGRSPLEALRRGDRRGVRRALLEFAGDASR